jgi:adhesin transport system outer membrane protein
MVTASLRAISLVLALSTGGTALAQKPTALPAPSEQPLEVDVNADPILRLSRAQASFAEFRTFVAAAVERHPGTAESVATSEEARAALREARERQLPSGDFSVTGYRVLSREFSDDPDNIVERSRPEQRTDALLSVTQTIFDFGAGDARVAGARASLRGSQADVEGAADRVALAAVASWYDVFGYRALLSLTQSFVASQRELKAAVEERVHEGVSAPGDVARVESYIAQTETRLAQYRRQLSNAEARFTELTGSPPPADIERSPPPATLIPSKDAATLAAETAPTVRAAEAAAEAARKEAKATRADRLGNLSGGIDAGRYGVFENDKDYDVRARISFRQRLFGGIDARVGQVDARARAAEARADRIREESSRDASIAWSDVQALEQQLASIQESYLAARRSRDVIAERFRVARGSLFDVVAAEDSYFESAASYIQSLTELDAARYVLLSRTGRLLDALAIQPEKLGG